MSVGTIEHFASLPKRITNSAFGEGEHAELRVRELMRWIPPSDIVRGLPSWRRAPGRSVFVGGLVKLCSF